MTENEKYLNNNLDIITNFEEYVDRKALKMAKMIIKIMRKFTRPKYMYIIFIQTRWKYIYHKRSESCKIIQKRFRMWRERRIEKDLKPGGKLARDAEQHFKKCLKNVNKKIENLNS